MPKEGVTAGIVQLIDLGNDFFLAKFGTQEDYEFALTGGSWMIRFPDLPVQFYDQEFLNIMGNKIGKTFKVDLTTTMQTRGEFARVCVQIDLEKPLRAHYSLKGRPMRIEYEGIHLKCFRCGKYGREKDTCIHQVHPPTRYL